MYLVFRFTDIRNQIDGCQVVDPWFRVLPGSLSGSISRPVEQELTDQVLQHHRRLGARQGVARLQLLLVATGLDPDGEDRLVLLRQPNDRKATRLQQEARRFCVIAFAADRRGDFEEAFDYLRDPEGPVAQALESHIGAGWFLTPPPIG